MRDIKFRAWDKLNLFMGFVRGINFHESEAIYAIRRKNILDYAWQPMNFKDLVLMQYTGIKDINNVEIYESDIVIPVKFKDIPNTVEYIEHGFYRVKNHNGKVYVNPLGNCQLKIIGNIFENPELINNL
jgi:uncharacterized phage protein (TIGR01671 family)